ncbi:MAG TPA: AAA family ATPase [Dokdonella sp.]
MGPTEAGHRLAIAPTGVPRIVALMGLPGAGKSMVARMLEVEFGLRLVSRDAIRAAMFPRCDHSFAEKQAALHGVMLAVEINGLLGASSVIDGVTFSRSEDRRRVIELARRHAFGLCMLMLDCPVEVARERVRVDRDQRAHPAADRTCELVDAVAARFVPPPADALRIDASLPPEEVLRLAREALVAALASPPNPVAT